jgi:hypothetical protein
MTKKSQSDAKDALAEARAEIDRMEKAVDEAVTTKGAVDCTCDNPGCSGAEPFTYAAAVVAAFAGGVSA